MINANAEAGGALVNWERFGLLDIIRLVLDLACSSLISFLSSLSCEIDDFLAGEEIPVVFYSSITISLIIVNYTEGI